MAVLEIGSDSVAASGVFSTGVSCGVTGTVFSVDVGGLVVFLGVVGAVVDSSPIAFAIWMGSWSAACITGAMAIATDIKMQQLFHVARFFIASSPPFRLLPEGEGKRLFQQPATEISDHIIIPRTMVAATFPVKSALRGLVLSPRPATDRDKASLFAAARQFYRPGT